MSYRDSVSHTTSCHVVHLGISGFPNGLGAMQRLILIFKGLVFSGAHVLVINRKPRYLKSQYPDLTKSGTFEGIPFQYLTDSPYKSSNFLMRNFQKIVGFIREFTLLRKRKKEGRLDVAILYILGEIQYLLYYFILSRILGFPIILNYVELNSSFSNRNLRNRINDYLFERLSPKMADGFLPISDYLLNHVQRWNADARQLKIPVIADFDHYQIPETSKGKAHLLYCGAASYHELIEFVLNAFEKAEISDTPIHFILGGTHQEINIAKTLLNRSTKSSLCILFENLPHEQVPQRLISAAGLLIPLRPTVQDIARFPHKVGEYLASGTPIVTTGYGEIANYLTDHETAYVAASYHVDSFARKIEELILNPEQARKIGLSGRSKAEAEFDYKQHGQALLNFIKKIIDKSPE
ncbi:MAG: glycosyltransferase [Saprospiraceae bacterium]|nr:glycosyltransferase [Saprospiraceae bacterium]